MILAVDGKACLAIDSGTRERSAAEAVAIVERFAPLLKGADIAFKKVDSLFRGPWAAELAACFRLGYWRHCIVAPAFPHHGRRTRDGRQFMRAADGTWRDVSGDLAEALKAEGLPASLAPVGKDLADGICIFDAETDADLDRIVALARQARGPVLWCGTGGLARALARGREVGASRMLERPVLGLFGSDQPVTRAQLEACGSSWVEIGEDGDVGCDNAPARSDRRRARQRRSSRGARSRRGSGADRENAGQRRKSFARAGHIDRRRRRDFARPVFIAWRRGAQGHRPGGAGPAALGHIRRALG